MINSNLTPPSNYPIDNQTNISIDEVNVKMRLFAIEQTKIIAGLCPRIIIWAALQPLPTTPPLVGYSFQTNQMTKDEYLTFVMARLYHLCPEIILHVAETLTEDVAELSSINLEIRKKISECPIRVYNFESG